MFPSNFEILTLQSNGNLGTLLWGNLHISPYFLAFKDSVITCINSL